MRTYCRLVLFAVWLLSRMVGYLLPASGCAADHAAPLCTVYEQNPHAPPVGKTKFLAAEGALRSGGKLPSTGVATRAWDINIRQLGGQSY